MIRRLIMVFACLAVLVTVYGCGGDEPAPPETEKKPAGPVYLGLVAPQTGPLAAVGENMIRSARQAVADANEARKGVKGLRPIELLVEDEDTLGQTPPEKRLTADPRVSIMIGYTLERSLEKDRARLIETGRPVILPLMGSSWALSLGDGYFYSNMPNESFEAAELGRYAGTSLKAGKALVVYEDSPYGQLLLKAFKGAFGQTPGTAVDAVPFPEDAESLLALASGAKETSPDAVFLALHASPAIYIAQALHRAEVKTVILGTHALAMTDMVSLLDRLFDKAFLSLPFDPGHPTDAAGDFVKAWEEERHTSPGWPAVMTYDAVMLAVKAYDAGEGDPVKIKAFLDGLPQLPETFTGLAGRYTFQGQGVCAGPVYIVKADSSLLGRIP